jgi:hypothetical protein
MRYAGLAVIASLLLASCVSMSEIDSTSEIGHEEVVIVGRIELDPPLQDHEQNLPWTAERYRNQVVFLIDDRIHLPEQVGLADLSLMQRAELGGLFYARVPRAPVLYYSAPRVMLDSANYMDLPGGLEIAIPPDAHMVYFGSLIYARDVYSAITGMELRNELEQTRKEVAARFGPESELTPTTVQPAR